MREKQVELESYFDFVSAEDIRIKGTRIGIETVLEDYLDGASPEEIAADSRTAGRLQESGLRALRKGGTIPINW